VVFQTITGSSIGLVAGVAPATPTAGAGAGAAATSVYTTPTYGVAASGTGVGPAQFTGAASKGGVAAGVLGAAVAFAVFAV